MTPVALSFAVLLALIAFGIPIGLSMITIGLAGLYFVGTLNSALTQLTLVYWAEGNSFLLLSLPFYILMGNLIHHTGIARSLYRSASLWLNWLPGGLAVASVFACAGFGAVSGSSAATARTMGGIVIPEMKRYGYGMRLGTGVMSASGTLGILIPPSIIMVFYGLMTETSIGDLFVAGIVPGICISIIFSAIVLITAVVRPSEVGQRIDPESFTRRDMYISLFEVLPVLGIFAVILGGLYLGVFTPTEASAIGVVAVLVYGALSRKLSLAAVKNALSDSALTTAMLFLIIVGGYLFTRFLAQTGLMGAILDFMNSLDLNYWEFIFAVTVLYLLLGCILDLFGMLILTVPILFPFAMSLGIDPVWFGIYIVIVAEVALVTPPIGVNVYIINAVAKDVPLGMIFRGCIPFVAGMLMLVAALAVWPEIALFAIR